MNSTLKAKVFQAGNSRAVRLPRQVKARVGQVYLVEADGAGLRLTDPAELARRRRALRKFAALPVLRAEWPRP